MPKLKNGDLVIVLSDKFKGHTHDIGVSGDVGVFINYIELKTIGRACLVKFLDGIDGASYLYPERDIVLYNKKNWVSSFLEMMEKHKFLGTKFPRHNREDSYE